MDSPPTQRRDLLETERQLERERLIVILATVGINVLVVSLLTFVPSSNWRMGLALNLIDNLILIGFTIAQKDRVMGRLLLFGLVVGIVELATDAWIVDFTHTLDYAWGGGPMIWRSPMWMPAAWEVVAVQFGYLGLRLHERFGLRGLLAIGILGAINIPFYEEMALKIHWWRYHDALMAPGTHTPWAIIVGEFFIAVSLSICARWTRKHGLVQSLVAGVIAGASIFPLYALPYEMLRG